MQGESQPQRGHGISREMIWTNAGHAQIVDQRIIMWRTARRINKA